MREVWNQAGILVGDTVLFIVRVQRANQGFPAPQLDNPRGQVIGFASTPRSVVVLRADAAWSSSQRGR
jgi:hypothetical protein